MDPDETRIVERRTRLVVDQMSRRVMKRMGQLRITAVELGERMGVSRPRVSQLMHGDEMTVVMFDRLTVALEVTPEWWLKPVGRKYAKRPDPAAAMVERVKRISRGS